MVQRSVSIQADERRQSSRLGEEAKSESDGCMDPLNPKPSVVGYATTAFIVNRHEILNLDQFFN